VTRFASSEDEWRAYLDGTHPQITFGRRTFRHLPSSPRCRLCSVPFRGVGSVIFKPMGFVPWDKNPNLCRRCVTYLDRRGDEASGAEVELSFLFADVRHSSDLARQIGTMEFTRLMQRFYTTATETLIADDAIIEKFVGDEVVGFFLPLMTGEHHAEAAVHAAQDLMRAAGYGEGDVWLPLGAGVHTGTAFVGMVRRGESSDFTAFGDTINVTAHLASQAAPGEILVTAQAAEAAGLNTDGVERRHLDLKGHPMDAVVLTAPAGDVTERSS
jgi:adenylate cyclase